MHCIILLPDATGRVPTAQELRLRGFTLSTAVEPPAMLYGIVGTVPALPPASGVALAAEESASYAGAPPVKP